MNKNNVCCCNITQNQGEYVCLNCGTHVELDSKMVLPPCPTCGFDKYQKQN